MSDPIFEMREVETDESSLIELSDIEKHFGAVIALAGVSIAVTAVGFNLHAWQIDK